MAKLLLDSNIVIDILRNEQSLKEWFLSSLVNNSMACCEIIVAEVYAGVRPKEELVTREFFENLEFLPVDFFTAQLGGRFKNYYSRKGKVLSLSDCLIAATAVQSGYELVTRNIKDFPMPEIKLYSLLKIK